MIRIRGVIFDLDGVLTGTEEFHYQAWQKMADEENWFFNRTINEQLRGVSRRASLEIILNGLCVSEQKIQECMERKNRYYQEMLQGISEKDIYYGVMPLLRQLKSYNLKIGIGSASRNAPMIMNKLQIADWFDCIGDGSCVIRTKPESDIFIYVAGAMNVSVEECLVVEDAYSGILAAKNCGMRTVGIGPKERVGGADYIYNTTGDIDVEEILKGR